MKFKCWQIGAKIVLVALPPPHPLFPQRERGWAWSRALLGIPAREVHLCGNESALAIVQKICEATGETLEVCETHFYLV
jgi:ATP-dependent RNA helicase SUPV3L1/SUV3